MEAAGIEPACRDISMQASTCVFDYLSFATWDSNRQDSQEARGELVLTSGVLHMTFGESELASNFQVSPTKTLSWGYNYLGSQCKVIVCSYCLVGFLRGLLTNHDTQLTLQAIRSIPVRPRCKSLQPYELVSEISSSTYRQLTTQA